jgi:hypothetical protein
VDHHYRWDCGLEGLFWGLWARGGPELVYQHGLVGGGIRVMPHLPVLQNHDGTMHFIFLARFRVAEYIEVEFLLAFVGLGFVVQDALAVHSFACANIDGGAYEEEV